MRTIILHWYGPYTLDEVLSDNTSGNGIYLITGKRPYERESNIQYYGITERKFAQRIRAHHKVQKVSRELRFWLGEVSYPVSFSRDILEISEKIIVYAWQYELNERKKYEPPQPTTILNFWFNKNRKPRLNQLKIYKDFMDVLSWDGDYWRTGNLRVE